MSLGDFDSLAPAEFRAVRHAWVKHEELRTATLLSAVRTHAAISIAPHVKKVPEPRELIHIPMIDDRITERPRMTREEQKARMKELKKQRGYG